MAHPKISVVVPAFNEAERIGVVLEAIGGSSLVDEIVVVDDGSRDGTAEAAGRFPVRVLRRQENGGKGAAIETAKSEVEAEIIVFIDADLLGLKPEHIDQLIEPLLTDPALMMTVGKFVGGRLRTDLAQRIVPTISGQRAVRKTFLQTMPDASNARFGVEIIFTAHARAREYPITEVLISGVTQVMKEEKRGYLRGIKDRAGMYMDIVRESANYRRRKKKGTPERPLK